MDSKFYKSNLNLSKEAVDLFNQARCEFDAPTATNVDDLIIELALERAEQLVSNQKKQTVALDENRLLKLFENAYKDVQCRRKQLRRLRKLAKKNKDLSYAVEPRLSSPLELRAIDTLTTLSFADLVGTKGLCKMERRELQTAYLTSINCRNGKHRYITTEQIKSLLFVHWVIEQVKDPLLANELNQYAQQDAFASMPFYHSSK